MLENNKNEINSSFYKNEIKILEENGFVAFKSGRSFVKKILHQNEEYSIRYLTNTPISARLVIIYKNDDVHYSSECFGHSKALISFDEKDLVDIIESTLLLYKLDNSDLRILNRYFAPNSFVRKTLYSDRFRIQKRNKGSTHRIVLNLLKKYSYKISYHHKIMGITLENFDEAIDYFNKYR